MWSVTDSSHSGEEMGVPYRGRGGAAEMHTRNVVEPTTTVECRLQLLSRLQLLRVSADYNC